MPRSREAQRRSSAERYAHYRTLRAQFNVPFREPWGTHYKQLLQAAAQPERRLTKAEHFAFWRERLTDKEIRDRGSAIDFLTSEGRQVT